MTIRFIKEARHPANPELSHKSDIAQDEKGGSQNSKVPIHPTIRDGLEKLNYGGVFTTPGSSRIYVVTRGTWGAKSKDKVVKGFPAGTSMEVVKGYAKRTQVKHGGQKDEDEK